MVKKSSLCWLLSNAYEVGKISTDRLKRFFASPKPTLVQGKRTKIEAMEEIYIGEWCIFKEDEALIGHVLGFSYLTGTAKKMEYTLPYALTIPPELNKRGIGVLANWYMWNKKGQLSMALITHHGYLDINNYLYSIPKPDIKSNILQICEEALAIIKLL